MNDGWIELTEYSGRKIMINMSRVGLVRPYESRILHAELVVVGYPKNILVQETYDDIKTYFE